MASQGEVHAPCSLLNASPVEVDLTSCLDVSYERRNGEHGVKFADGDQGEEGWTRVVGRRRRTRKSSDSRSSDSEEELLISENASVLFSCIGGEPGLSVKTTKTRSWTPIAARTRLKFK